MVLAHPEKCVNKALIKLRALLVHHSHSRLLGDAAPGPSTCVGRTCAPAQSHARGECELRMLPAECALPSTLGPSAARLLADLHTSLLAD